MFTIYPLHRSVYVLICIIPLLCFVPTSYGHCTFYSRKKKSMVSMSNVVCVPRGQYHFLPLQSPSLDGKGFSLR